MTNELIKTNLKINIRVLCTLVTGTAKLDSLSKLIDELISGDFLKQICQQNESLYNKMQVWNPGTSFEWDSRALCEQISKSESKYVCGPRVDVCISCHYI